MGDCGSSNESGVQSSETLVEKYMHEVMRLHSISVSIVLDKNILVKSHFWKNFQNSMGSKLEFNTIYHLETIDLSERTI